MIPEGDEQVALEVERRGQAALLHIRGSVGFAEADELREQLSRLADEKCDPIVLNLEGMYFIASAGLGALVEAHLKARHHQGQIRLLNPRPTVRRLFETTRLTKLFPVFEDDRTALGE